MVPAELKSAIASAFADVPYPGDGELSRGELGVEPERVELKFRGKKDWRSLAPEFLDDPDALPFFSNRALRF